MRTPLAIAGVELRRFLRDRSNIFFALVFPLLLVLMIGLQFGEDASARRAIVVGAPSQLRDDLVSGLEEAEVRVTLAVPGGGGAEGGPPQQGGEHRGEQHPDRGLVAQVRVIERQPRDQQRHGEADAGQRCSPEHVPRTHAGRDAPASRW